MPYEESSYAEVLLWLEGTEIQYVPHGKKAGTKSYDRYEKYSQAKTVAEALEFGSKPLDLVHDYEKKLLKRVGGTVREKPLNLAEVADPSTLTKTDKILGRWGYLMLQKDQGEGEAAAEGLKKRRMEQKEAYRKAQLSAQYGVKADELAKGTGWAESPAMVAMRSRANLEASSILDNVEAETRKVTDEDVLKVLRLWAVKKNGDRKNVFPDGMNWVHSETIGLLHCAGSRLMATLHCNQYPKVLTLLAKWMRDNRPDGHTKDFPFTSITVNSSFSCRRHRDHVNVGPSAIKAFGQFEGGEMKYWGDDNKTTSVDLLLEKDATTFTVRDQVAIIDGNRAHEVTAFSGEERFSLVFFTAQSFEKTLPEVRDQLIQLGIPFPDDEAVAYLKGLLPPPKGYAEYAEKVVTDAEKVAKDGKMGALAALKGLQKPKKGILVKMLAMRASGAATASPAGGASAEVEGIRKKALTPLASKGLLARVLAKRANGESGSKVPAVAGVLRTPGLARKPKTAAFGGLLARVQKKAQAQPDAASEVTNQAPGVPTSSPAKAATESAQEDDVDMSPGMPATDTEAQSATPVREEEESPALKLGPAVAKASAKRKSKPLSFGGLLARVQKRQHPGEASPSENSGTTTPPAESTPARKRPRENGAQGVSDVLSFSGKKSDPPVGLLKRCLVQSATKSAESKSQVSALPEQSPAVQIAGKPHHFLSFASLCCSTAENSPALLAQGLRQMGRGTDTCSPHDMMQAAMVLLVPSDNVPVQPLAAAIAEAFGMPCDPNVRGEMLAAKALEGRQRRPPSDAVGCLSVKDVADAKVLCSRIAEEDFGTAVQRLVKLFAATQGGMEPFLLVRALQGKLSPETAIMHSALAQAMLPA